MKPRHAAALALVGWYLMMPPMGNGKVYVTAPLIMWQIVVSVSTLKDCKNVLLNYEKHPTQISDSKVREAMKLRISHGICMSADDPRLKQK
ncbi:MAG: hypothetical protein WB662_07665 [Methyloceanibacter sp.]